MPFLVLEMSPVLASLAVEWYRRLLHAVCLDFGEREPEKEWIDSEVENGLPGSL